MAVQPNLASGLAKESYWWHPPTPDPRPHAELLLRRTHRCAFEPDVSEVHVHLGVCGRRVDSVIRWHTHGWRARRHDRMPRHDHEMARTRLEGTPPCMRVACAAQQRVGLWRGCVVCKRHARTHMHACTGWPQRQAQSSGAPRAHWCLRCGLATPGRGFRLLRRPQSTPEHARSAGAGGAWLGARRGPDDTTKTLLCNGSGDAASNVARQGCGGARVARGRGKCCACSARLVVVGEGAQSPEPLLWG